MEKDMDREMTPYASSHYYGSDPYSDAPYSLPSTKNIARIDPEEQFAMPSEDGYSETEQDEVWMKLTCSDHEANATADRLARYGAQKIHIRHS